MPPLGTLEVDVRRSSGQELLERLERTTGVKFIVRKARVTARRSRWLLEIAPGDSKDKAPRFS
jgi:hypothetical protein